MRRRVLFLIRTYLWTVAVFIVAKIAFMFYCREGHDFSFGDVMDVLQHGLSLDLSTALYFLILPFLVMMVSIWWNKGKALQRILHTYFIIISIAFALAFVADTSLYPFWGFKLDASCLQYLTTPKEAAASVSFWYLLIRLVAFIAIAGIISFGYLKETRRQGDKETGAFSDRFLDPQFARTLGCTHQEIRSRRAQRFLLSGSVYRRFHQQTEEDATMGEPARHLSA